MGWQWTEEEAQIVNFRKRKEFLDRIRHKQTRQGAFEESFLHFDHPLFGGGPLLEPSDRGKAAAMIRMTCEEVPWWRTLWDRARGKQTRKQSGIAKRPAVERGPYHS